jgi:hypothetical protein
MNGSDLGIGGYVYMNTDNTTHVGSSGNNTTPLTLAADGEGGGCFIVSGLATLTQCGDKDLTSSYLIFSNIIAAWLVPLMFCNTFGIGFRLVRVGFQFLDRTVLAHFLNFVVNILCMIEITNYRGVRWRDKNCLSTIAGDSSLHVLVVVQLLFAVEMSKAILSSNHDSKEGKAQSMNPEGKKKQNKHSTIGNVSNIFSHSNIQIYSNYLAVAHSPPPL